MKSAFALAKKDISLYFNSWIGILIFVFFYLLSGIFFCLLVLSFAKISMEAAQTEYQNIQGLGLTRFVFSSYFLNLAAVLMFLIPVFTMRAISEERKAQTLELLYTFPLSDFDIVWGKFLALLGFFILLSLPTLGYIPIIVFLGGALDWGPILMGYFGFAVLGTAYLSLGLFVSSLTESQVISAIITFALLVIFWILEWVAGVTDGFWSHFFSALSPLTHYREFAYGVFDLSNFTYFLFFMLFFLFLTLRSIEVRNWKG